MENHFSAGDASLEEKERALYAEAAPREKNLLLHSPDGREAESSEKTAAGAPTAPGQGSDPEASLSNASASESASSGDPAGPREASALLSEGEGETGEDRRPELSAGEGPAEEAEGQAGSGAVPEEAEKFLADSPVQGAAAGASPDAEAEQAHTPETAGEGSPRPDQGPEGPDGVLNMNTEAREVPEDQGEPGPSPATETGGAQEDRPQEVQAPGRSKEDPEKASSEEEGGSHDEEEGGVPSQEEAEDSSDGASSEEAGASSEEAGESQEAAETPSGGDEGAQLSSEEPNPGPQGDEALEAQAEEPEEGPQGRGPRNCSGTWAAALFLDVLYVVGQAGTGWGGTAPASLGLWVEAPSRVPGPGGCLWAAYGLLLPSLEGPSERPRHGGP